MDNVVKRDTFIRLRAGGNSPDAGGTVGGHRYPGGFPESREHRIVERVGRVVKERVKLHSPLLGEKEAEYVAKCCRDGEVTHGPYVQRFEDYIKAKVGVKYAIAVSSGTAALHLALMAAGVGKGDRVVVPAFTFVATANAVSYCGATPEFVDCDEYGGLSAEKLDEWLKTHSVKAVIPVHIFGHCCDMDALQAVCDKHGVLLIEDAAQALGSYYYNNHAGSFGIAAAFSFNGNKTITTGGGGAVVTNSRDVADRVRLLANVAKEDVPHEYWHVEVGFNYRLPNIAAALGCAQFESLYDILNRKRYLAQKYREAFEFSDEGQIINQGPNRTSNNWLNALVTKDVDKRRLLVLLDEAGFESRLCWTPLHLMTMYKDNPRDDLTNTMRLASTIVNLPSGPGIVP